MPTQNKTISFIINSLEFGGAQRVFIDDANDFVRNGFDVVFFVLYGEEGEFLFEKELDPAVHTIFLHARGVFDFSAIKKCASKLRKQQVRTIISTLNDGNIFARWVAIVVGRKIRLIQREANALTSKTALQKMLDVFLFWVPYRILALSTETRDSIARLLPFSRNKILLLPNAVSVPTFVSLRERNPIPCIISVGRLTSQKNYELLITALARLAQAGLFFTATIVGEGYLRSSLEMLAREKGLEGKVVFPGNLSHEDVLRLYAASNLFVSSSLWEGSPNVILEAMSYGLPVVATNVGGTRDVITDGKDGLLVPSGQVEPLSEAIGKVLSDEKLSKELGVAARNRVVTAFSRETRFERLRAIVKES